MESVVPKAKLTKRLVTNAQPQGADYVIWDTSLTRFGLKVSAGGHKTFIVKYRHFRRQRKLTVGRADVIAADDARTLALNLLNEVGNGRDPARARQVLVTEPTVEEAFNRFLVEHVEMRRKSSTAKEYARLFKARIGPYFSSRRLSDIHPRDLSDLHKTLRGTPYQANRAIALMSKFFNWCESPSVGLRSQRTNPCHEIERFREHGRTRFLSPAEINRLGRALIEAENREWPWAVAAIRLLVFTGARKSEILTLKWPHVDIERRRLSLPDSKTGAKIIVLSVPALEVVQLLHAMRKAFPASPWVIPSPRDASRPFIQLQSVWERVRHSALLIGVRLHDLRHSFASIAAARGTQQHLIKAMLGHSQLSTTIKYMHYADDPLRVASDEVAVHIAAIMGASPKT